MDYTLLIKLQLNHCEVDVPSRISHPNIMPLIQFRFNKQNRPEGIYELANMTLESYINTTDLKETYDIRRRYAFELLEATYELIRNNIYH